MHNSWQSSQLTLDLRIMQDNIILKMLYSNAFRLTWDLPSSLLASLESHKTEMGSFKTVYKLPTCRPVKKSTPRPFICMTLLEMALWQSFSSLFLGSNVIFLLGEKPIASDFFMTCFGILKGNIKVLFVGVDSLGVRWVPYIHWEKWIGLLSCLWS